MNNCSYHEQIVAFIDILEFKEMIGKHRGSDALTKIKELEGIIKLVITRNFNDSDERTTQI